MAELAPRFRAAAADLARYSSSLAALIFGRWEAGHITDDEFEATLHTALMEAAASGVAVGDVLGSQALGAEPVGLALDEETIARLGLAAKTARGLLDSTEDPLPRLIRLAVGTHLDSLQQGTVKAYDRHGVHGYTRGLSANACELCRWLWKDGYVYPTDQPMSQHPGCTCVPIPTGKETA